jgi:HEAT repeat protein
MKHHFVAMLLGCAAVVLLGLASGCGGSSKPQVDLQAQLDILESGDADAKAVALAEIATLQADAASAVPQLTETLKDPDATVRRLAAYALGQIGPEAKSAVPSLRNLLKDTDRDVITATLNAIRAIDPEAPESKVSVPNVTTQ